MGEDYISDVLRHDSIKETEDFLCGKDYHDFDETEQRLSLRMAIEHNQYKNDFFFSIGDTSFKMSWSDFKNKMFQYGFEIGLSYPLETKGDEKTLEEAILLYHQEKGLIIWATSYCGRKSLNEGSCWGEIETDDLQENKTGVWRWLSTGGLNEQGFWETSFDVREGFFHRLQKLESFGVFQKKWHNSDRHLWFLDWNEMGIENYDYKQITADKIAKASKEVGRIINRSENEENTKTDS